MIKQKVQEEINEQIQAEFQSAYAYLALSGWFESQNLSGFAHWSKKQWNEEIEHGMKFYEHLIKRDGEVVLKNIEAPSLTIDTPEDAFEQALEQERNITKRIHKLYDLAQKEGDYPLESLLLWFIDEQVEEEDMVRKILDDLKLIKNDASGMLLMDKELAKRESNK
jgi:ferritin